ncbi:FmdB family zinc ribbon protein [Halomonas sp. M20]|uniref:FmdB family zinc ribbon protein n=1 Tax=Halomonas sp. M20 TaxID=2763264 RepID=UPI001D0A5D1A|nr:zinc ribbon domain-containing protein [Halomonas sp. M20]
MPIYEYQCKACGQRLEKLQKINAAPLTQCPHCEQQALTRLISAAGFRLAGGGWYETDFKSGGKKNLAGDKSDASKAPDAKKADGGSQDGKSQKAKPQNSKNTA